MAGGILALHRKGLPPKERFAVVVGNVITAALRYRKWLVVNMRAKKVIHGAQRIGVSESQRLWHIDLNVLCIGNLSDASSL